MRLETRYTAGAYKLYKTTVYPPAIEVIDPYNDTASHGSAGKIRLQWQHVGATYYIIERSTDNVTYSRVGIQAGSGNVWHTFVFPATNGRSYWKVYPANEDENGYYKTGYAIPMTVDQSSLPVMPDVSVSYSGGNAVIAAQVEVAEEAGLDPANSAVTYGGTLDDKCESL